MFFSYRTRQRLKWGTLVAGGGVFLFGALGYFLPWSGKTPLYSAGAWALAVVSVVVVWVFLEALGIAFLSLGFWERLPAPVRISVMAVIGVSILGALLLLGANQ